MDNLPHLSQGQRATVAGRTGSGKSTLARWLLMRSPGHWLILNPKHTSAYKSLPDAETIRGFDMKKIERSLGEHRFTIINPSSAQSTPEVMDAFVEYMHNEYKNIGLCVDELYSLHMGNAKAGAGLTGWLTRGRELKQSFLGLTQRPAWISKFLFSESDYIGGMALALDEDRKRMYQLTGHYEYQDKLPPRKWLWYTAEDDSLKLFGPVPPN